MQTTMAARAGTLALGALALAGAARAGPVVEIRHAAARVTIVPEARGDIQVRIVRANGVLPLHLSGSGQDAVVDGGLALRWPSCRTGPDGRSVNVFGVGRIAWEDLPQLVVRVPLDAEVRADGAVYGTVGRGRSLRLSTAGCGDWAVADQSGDLEVHAAGSGDVRAGSAQRVEVEASGSSDIGLRKVRAGLTSRIAGSGDVDAAWVDGPLHAHIAGSGDLTVAAGHVPDLDASIAGSGAMRFGGVAGTVKASIAGSGDLCVAHATGPVERHVAGSGNVTIGR